MNLVSSQLERKLITALRTSPHATDPSLYDWKNELNYKAVSQLSRDDLLAQCCNSKELTVVERLLRLQGMSLRVGV